MGARVRGGGAHNMSEWCGDRIWEFGSVVANGSAFVIGTFVRSDEDNFL